MNGDQTASLSGHDPKDAVAKAFDEMQRGPRLADAAPPATETGDVAGSVRRAATQNPVWLLLAATALGYFAGTSLPMSERERDYAGPAGDRLGTRARQAVDDLVDDGKRAAMNAVANALGSSKR